MDKATHLFWAPFPACTNPKKLNKQSRDEEEEKKKTSIREGIWALLISPKNKISTYLHNHIISPKK